MIRIDRGQEPAGLAAIRSAELKRVVEMPDPSSKIGKKYRAYAGELRARQNYKCCYCEIHLLTSFNDVEHYRPKARADRLPGSKATHGYWWLAWTWKNLLFACPSCNRSGKNARFPLADGSRALEPQEQPPGSEQALLVDPAAENGIDWIQFRSDVPKMEGRWVPTARDGCLKGDRTIKVLDLDRAELLDFYDIHVELDLQPIIEDVEEAIATGNRDQVQEAWARALRELRPHNEFVGLTFDVFDQSFPENVRNRWALPLPRPSAGDQATG